MKKFAYLALMASISMAASADDNKVKAPTNALYTQECGSCHVPYPTRLLSASEWQSITSRLDKHFGVDASLDANTVKLIQQYLSANSASQNRTSASGDKLPRITESRWFIHEHNEVSPKTLQRLKVKSMSNCGACHANMDMRRAY